MCTEAKVSRYLFFRVMKRSLALVLTAAIAINAQTTPPKSTGGDVGSLLLPMMAKGIPFGPAPKGCSDFEVLVGE